MGLHAAFRGVGSMTGRKRNFVSWPLERIGKQIKIY